MSALISRASLYTQREDSLLLFICKDLCLSSGASSIVLFGCSEEEDSDDALSLAASDTGEWSIPVEDSTTLLQSRPDDSQPRLDSEVIRVLSIFFF